MQDSEIVTATAAGEPDGLAAAYDRYAAPLLAFCCALLGERADAVDAVQDTFLVAAAQLEGLTEPDQLRPWLYAVARNECHRKLSARAHADGAPGALSDDTIDFGVNVERAELDEVVRAALAGLDPAEREAIEMSLRQAFSPDDLASALSLSRNQASTLASRARGEYARTLGTLLVARAGRPYCSKLDEMLDGWDGNLTVLLRKRLSRHIRMCRTCTERRRRELEPALMLSVLPAVEIARGLRPQVLQLAASSAPEAVAYRASVVRRAAPFDDQGFPVPIDPPKVARRARRPVIVVSAAAALALLAAVGFEAGLANNHPGTDAATASLGNQAGVPQAAGASTSSGSSSASSSGGHGKRRSLLGPASSVSVTPGVTPSGTLTITPTSPGSTSPTSPSTGPSSTPPSSTPPSSSPPPISGTLSASPGSVTLGESPSGGYPTGSFTLSATGGSVTYAEELIVSPSSGTLAAGQSITITVTWESSATMDADLAVGPDGPGVSVAYDAPTPAPSPTPSTEPTTASPS
jgi:RNA polymerase sigma factor (sigma-70 family)